MSTVYAIGGQVQASGGIYVPREADQATLQACREGGISFILNTRQVGKSSLMIQTAKSLFDEGAAVCIVDLTEIGANLTSDQWYRGILRSIAEQTGVSLDVIKWWDSNSALGPTDRFSRFLRDVLLQQFPGKRIVIFFDEIDTTLRLPFRGPATDDFFAALRALHLGGALQPELARLSIVLIGVAEPTDLVEDPNRTPFNVGRKIELRDFSESEAEALLPGSGIPPADAKHVLRQVLVWTSGHPYLTLRAFHSFQEHPLSGWTEGEVGARLKDLYQGRAIEDDSNVRFVRDMLLVRAENKLAVLQKYWDVARGKPVRDEVNLREVIWLKLAGVVREVDGYLKCRNRVYAGIFTADWARENLPPDYWQNRLRKLAVAWSPWLLAAIAAFIVPSLFFETRRQQSDAAKAKYEAAQARDQVTSAQSDLARLNKEGRKRTEEELAAVRESKKELLALKEEKDRAQAQLSAAIVSAAALEPATAETARLPLLVDSIRSGVTVSGLGGMMQDVAQQRKLRVTLWHQGSVRSVAFSPDGKMVATASDDKTARLWDAATGVPRATLSHQGPVHSVVFSPDGKMVATLSTDNAAQLWDAATGQPRATLSHQGLVNSVAFSPDGKTVATASSDKTGRLWDAATGELRATLSHQDVVISVTFSPDGRTMATASFANGARLWDVATGLPRSSLFDPGFVDSVAFSPDGKFVATAGSNNNTAWLWDVATGQARAVLPHQRPVRSIAFSPNGRIVATASADNSVRLWDAVTTILLRATLSHQDSVNSIAFSPDGKTVATASDDKTARLWDAATGQPRAILSHQGPVHSVAFSPDGKTVATVSTDNAARLWDAATGQPRATLSHQAFINAVALSPDGKTAATGSEDNTAKLWSAATGQPRATLSHGAPVRSVAFSPDGRSVATASLDHTVRLWDAATGQPRDTILHQEDVISVVFSPDGKTVATASSDKTARLWDAATGESRAILSHQGPVNSVAFSPDGKTVATASYDKTAKLWNAATGQLRAVLSHQGPVDSAVFSPDGKTLATASGGNTARLWDAATGLPRATLFSQTPSLGEAVNSVTFSPDGTTVVTASINKAARLWDAATGRLRAVLSHQGLVRHVAFSPDGKTVATTSFDNTARLWDAATGQLRATLERIQMSSVTFSRDGKYLLVSTGSEAQFYLLRPPDLIQAACDYLPANLAKEEWQRYFPNEPYRKACPNLP